MYDAYPANDFKNKIPKNIKEEISDYLIKSLMDSTNEKAFNSLVNYFSLPKDKRERDSFGSTVSLGVGYIETTTSYSASFSFDDCID